MRVVCISDYPNKNQIRLLGPRFYPKRSFGLTVGQEYLVLGLSYDRESINGNTMSVYYFADTQVLSAPIMLFDIINERVSRYWEARKTEDDLLTLWPTLFYEDYFFDRLSDYEPEPRKAFWGIYYLLDNEDRASVHQVDPARDPVNEAFRDIRSAYITGQSELIAAHVRPEDKILVFTEREYDYSLNVPDYLEVEREILGNLQLADFVWRRMEWKTDDIVIGHGMKQFGEEATSIPTVYVSYTLKRVGANYFISEVGTSTKPTWDVM